MMMMNMKNRRPPRGPMRPDRKPMPTPPTPLPGQDEIRTAVRGMKKGGKVKSKAKGGSSYRKAADGMAHKGKTKAKMVKMAMGGKC